MFEFVLYDVFRNNCRYGLPDDFLGRIPKHLFGAPVPRYRYEVHVDGAYGIRNILDDRREEPVFSKRAV